MATADRALWKCQCPYPRGLPANVLKATIKIIQQCWVPRGIEENSLSLVPQPAQHMPGVSQSLLFRQLSALVLTPFPTRAQNQPKMLNRCHPVPQHELWSRKCPAGSPALVFQSLGWIRMCQHTFLLPYALPTHPNLWKPILYFSQWELLFIASFCPCFSI